MLSDIERKVLRVIGNYSAGMRFVLPEQRDMYLQHVGFSELDLRRIKLVKSMDRIRFDCWRPYLATLHHAIRREPVTLCRGSITTCSDGPALSSY